VAPSRGVPGAAINQNCAMSSLIAKFSPSNVQEVHFSKVNHLKFGYAQQTNLRRSIGSIFRTRSLIKQVLLVSVNGSTVSSENLLETDFDFAKSTTPKDSEALVGIRHCRLAGLGSALAASIGLNNEPTHENCLE
jgi:hypothetical protein